MTLLKQALTDYLEFRWYVRGEKRDTVRLATTGKNGQIKLEPNGPERVKELLTNFVSTQVQTVSNPKELAGKMAAIARLIRDTIKRTFEDEDKGGSLHTQLIGFRQVLLPDLTSEQFADMYAQTICYGLFAARFSASIQTGFTRQNAAYQLPKTNPFLRKMFNYIAGPDLDERVTWIVDDLAELLNRSDVGAILKDFGRRTRQEDPVVHFYETFLAQYDAKMRQSRGVYYTPEPVVSYIVRSVDHLLKTEFGLPKGLADSSKLQVKTPDGKHTFETHKVQILDPATGTGTFLHGVVDHIYETFSNNKGMWPGYVSDHLLPRLFGFELLMAPYTVAHMKLGLQLAETGYNFSSNERLKVYLTNTLEEGFEGGRLPFAEWLVEEANAAGAVKHDAPVMVVLGNPPYSGHSANNSVWIADLLRGKNSQGSGNYFMVDGKPLGEKNPKWLNDDYVKFIRFAQWRIERTGYGILAFISNHGYLDNPTFRGMRQSLMETFDDIYILDLHGNSKKKERSPDGSPDENVFDIQQGVAIGFFIKRLGTNSTQATVRHADLYGKRDEKYHKLFSSDVSSTQWNTLTPQVPFHLFVTQDVDLRTEFEQGWTVTNIYPVNSVGIVTARDSLTIHWNKEDVWKTINDFTNLNDEVAREKYNLGPDARDWKVTLAQKDLKDSGLSKNKLTPILYRPFDVRFTYYTGVSRGFLCMPRPEVMRNMVSRRNLAVVIGRSGAVTGDEEWNLLGISNEIVDFNFYRRGGNQLHPLYLYPDKSKATLFDLDEPTNAPGGRRPNLAPKFITEFAERLKLEFILDGKGDLQTTFGPEDIFNYMYTVFHSPTYRSRYAEFLKIDFPRLPLTSNVELFRLLCRLGSQLVSLHLMEKSGPAADTPGYPNNGDNIVEFVKYVEPGQDSASGRVFINKHQSFDGVPPEVWNFHIGGYQVCEKWLKDRKGRKLTFDDLQHYQGVVAALAETIRLMAEIDSVIEEYGSWPIQ